MTKISVIIPVFHSVDTILQCVDSLLRQTLDSIEVLLVDDHGGDGSVEKVQEYLRGSDREQIFRFLSTPFNGGPGLARNVGLDAAQGKYVFFLDSDDYIDDETCRLMYMTAEGASADLCCCNAIEHRGSRTRILENPPLRGGLFDTPARKAYLSHYVSYFTTFLYRRDLLEHNSIRFSTERSSEDTLFLFCCLMSALRVCSLSKPCYHYIVSPVSLSQGRNPSRYLDKFSAARKMLDYASSHGLYDVYREELEYLFIKKGFLMSAFSYVSNSEHPEKDTIVHINSQLKGIAPNFKDNKYLRQDLKARNAVRLFTSAPALATRLGPLFVKAFGLSV